MEQQKESRLTQYIHTRKHGVVSAILSTLNETYKQKQKSNYMLYNNNFTELVMDVKELSFIYLYVFIPFLNFMLWPILKLYTI